MSKSKRRKNFASLYKNIIKEGYCRACGGCSGICPINSIEFNGNLPKLADRCISCGACADICLRFKKRMEPSEAVEEFFSGVLEIYKGKTTLDEVKPYAQNGGVVTTLLLSALKQNRIDAALVTQEGENIMHPKPILATSEREILNAGGSKYTISKTLEKVKSIKTSHKHHVAVVGLPCHISTLTEMMNDQYYGLDARVAYKIGLFCMHSYTYEGLLSLIKKEFGLNPSDVKKMEIQKGKFHFETEDKTYKIKLKELAEAYAPGCHYCNDFGAKDADIAVGNVCAKCDENIIVVRTKKGAELLSLAVEAKMIEVKKIDKEDWHDTLGLAEKLARMKDKNAEPIEPLE